MKQRVLGIILPLALVLQPVAAGAVAGGPTLTVQLSSASVATNGQITATVQMNTKSYQVSAAEIHISYPSDKLQVLSIAAGSFLPNALVAGSVGSGTAAITAGSGTQPVQGSGPVAVITFKALTAGSATIAFTGATAVAAVGSSGNVVDAMAPTTVTITAGGTTASVAPATGSSAGTSTGQMTPTTSSAGIVGQVAQVSTGPLESTALALIIGSIAVLLYVGYTGSDTYRRRDAEAIAAAERSDPPDFRDPGATA